MVCDRGRLAWRCRRGMLELDAWLEGFLARHPDLTDAECECLLQLLDAEDDRILDWLLGRVEPPPGLSDLIERMREKHDEGRP